MWKMLHELTDEKFRMPKGNIDRIDSFMLKNIKKFIC